MYFGDLLGRDLDRARAGVSGATVNDSSHRAG